MTTSPSHASPTLASIASPGSLRQAWEHVRKGGATPGIDRLTPEQFAREAQAHLTALGEALLAGRYRPKPALRLRRPDDPDRPLAVPTVADRVVQRAIAKALLPPIEREASSASHAYRPGRSVDTALAQVAHWLRAGHVWVVRTDIEAFFDRIDRERLALALLPHVPDPALRTLIDRVVAARVLEGESLHQPALGVSQGSALSPLLSNLYLAPVDQALSEAGYPFVRYADDLILFGRSEHEALDALEVLTQALAALGLRLSARKTRRLKPGETFDFLGVAHTRSGRGPSRGALRALEHRCGHLAAAEEGDAQALADAVATFEAFHGPLDPALIDDAHVLLGAAMGATPRTERAAGLALRRLQQRVRSVPRWWRRTALTTWHHLSEDLAVLAEWMDLDPASRADGEVRDAAARALELTVTDLDTLPTAHTGWPAALERLGRRHLAGRIRAWLTLPEPPAAATGELPIEALVPVLRRTFPGAADRVAREGIDARGHLRFQFQQGGNPGEALAQHLRGLTRTGFAPLLAPGQLGVAVIEVMETRDEEGTLGAAPATSRAFDLAAAYRRAAVSLGAGPLLEWVSPDRARLWFAFAEPVPVRDARGLLVRVASAVGPPGDGLSVVAFPAADQLGEPGPALPYPLGVEPRCGHRGRFVSGNGEALEPLEALASIIRLDATTLAGLVRQGPLAGGRSARLGLHPVDMLRKHPLAQAIVSGCGVVDKLCRKALDLGHLEHIDKLTLVQVFGALPNDAGLRALQVILDQAGIGMGGITKLWRERPSHPLSCARLRERYAPLAGKCTCRFAGLRPGAYPTPVLHALKVSEVAEFRPATSKGHSRAASAPPTVSGNGAGCPELRQQGGDASGSGAPAVAGALEIGATEPEERQASTELLASLLEASSPAVRLESTGTVREVAPPASTDGARTPDAPLATADVVAVLAELHQARVALAEARDRVAEAEAHLTGLAGGHAVIDTPLGRLERRTDGWWWHIGTKT
jgi:group II intron reverse transcriptase/maturase